MIFPNHSWRDRMCFICLNKDINGNEFFWGKSEGVWILSECTVYLNETSLSRSRGSDNSNPARRTELAVMLSKWVSQRSLPLIPDGSQGRVHLLASVTSTRGHCVIMGGTFKMPFSILSCYLLSGLERIHRIIYWLLRTWQCCVRKKWSILEALWLLL